MPSIPAIPVALEEAEYGMEEELPLSAEAASLPEDMLREILSRVPFRSLCRFRCVSKPWSELCSDRTTVRRSLQTLWGFVCQPSNRNGLGVSFLNEYGRARSLVDPSQGFLCSRGYERVRLLDCCGGLLLCKGRNVSTGCWEYIVCNPVTDEIWTALPMPDAHVTVAVDNGNQISCLCFDPAVPSRFAIFTLLLGFGYMEQVDVYSSDTREWTSMTIDWDRQILVYHDKVRYVFLNDTLHFIAYDTSMARRDVERNPPEWIATISVDGNTWRIIPMPPQVKFSFIGQSQGRFYGMELDNGNCCWRMLVWVLEDYGSAQWTLKHTANISKLLGRPIRRFDENYWVVAIHPECNVIFFTGGVDPEERLMSYNMDSQELHVICPVEEYNRRTFQLYIPCFVERPSDVQ